jgi:CTP-dependent riboflavin kinase
MIKLRGFVCQGFGVAGPNLRRLEQLIAERMGIPSVVTGTLNVRIDRSYLVKPNGALSARVYYGSEVILRQRVGICGVAAVIMRPHTHQLSEDFGHGTNQLELMAAVRLRDPFGLQDGQEVGIELERDDVWWDALRSAT